MFAGIYKLTKKETIKREGKRDMHVLTFGDPMEYVNFDILCPDKIDFAKLIEGQEYEVGIMLQKSNYRLSAELRRIIETGMAKK